ncbi:MAG: hypothetical protein P1U85_02930 [Verrucomicrobiales bacterium]|nr:hypothetical protein [Verrucomicrobiales bacterium]
MDSQKEEKRGILENRLWRLAIVLFAYAAQCLLIGLLRGIPFRDIFLVPVIYSLYLPQILLIGFLLSLWWILDRRIPLFVIILVYAIPAVLIISLPKGPPGMSEEERAAIEEAMGEGFLEEIEERNRQILEDRKNSETDPTRAAGGDAPDPASTEPKPE